jgi:hypothetical protein
MLTDHQAYEPVLVIAGSLAYPASSGALVGLIDGIGRLRRVGEFQHRVFVVMGIGGASGPGGGNVEKTRALVARALFDVESCLAADPSHRGAPVYLVGEEPFDGAASDRPTQARVAALAALGLTRSVVRDHQPLQAGWLDPFAFTVDAARSFHFVNGPYLGARSFSVLGGYAVSCPADHLVRGLAASLCAQVFGALAEQPACATIHECGRLEVPVEIGYLVEEVQARLASRLWANVSEHLRVRWNPPTDAGPGPEWFDLDRIRSLFEPIFDDEEWRRVLTSYGEDRIRRLPLEDWVGALDELVNVIETGVLPRRRLRASSLTTRILRVLLDELERGVAEVFGRAFRPPIGLEPHRTAQAFLGRIHSHLTGRREELRQLHLLETVREPSEPRRKRIEVLRDDLTAALSAVPSPASVLLRLLPLLGASISLAWLFPAGLGALDGPLGRLGLGAGVGFVAFGALFVHRVDLVRRRLLRTYRDWFALYTAQLTDDDEALRREAYRGLLDRMIAIVEWYFNGTTEEPPLPDEGPVKLKSHAPREPPHPDLLRSQVVLSSWQGPLGEARDAYDAATQDVAAAVEPSFVETCLPDIRATDRRVLQEEETDLLAVAALGGRSQALARLMTDVAQWCLDEVRRGGEPQLVAFVGRGAAADDAMAFSTWRRRFLMPSGSELLSAETRVRSSGFAYFEAVRTYLAARYANLFDLPERLDRHARLAGVPLDQTSLGQRYANYCVPTVATTGGRVAHYVIGAGVDDPLASSAGCVNELGRRRLSVHLQVRPFLSAQAVVFFPNSGAPANPLGRAWKAHEAKPWTDQAFEPAFEPAPGDVP